MCFDVDGGLTTAAKDFAPVQAFGTPGEEPNSSPERVVADMTDDVTVDVIFDDADVKVDGDDVAPTTDTDDPSSVESTSLGLPVSVASELPGFRSAPSRMSSLQRVAGVSIRITPASTTMIRDQPSRDSTRRRQEFDRNTFGYGLSATIGKRIADHKSSNRVVVGTELELWNHHLGPRSGLRPKRGIASPSGKYDSIRPRFKCPCVDV